MKALNLRDQIFDIIVKRWQIYLFDKDIKEFYDKLPIVKIDVCNMNQLIHIRLKFYKLLEKYTGIYSSMEIIKNNKILSVIIS